MFATLNKYKVKKLLTLNRFVNKVKSITIDDVKNFNKELSEKPQRTDFIPYDNEGNLILNHKPLFKGWTLCKETSSEKHKVAKLTTVGDSFRLYFDTADGLTLVSTKNMADNCTYNDLAIFFESNLELA